MINKCIIITALLLFNYLIYPIRIESQIPSWPPGGNSPASFAGAENLPGKRFLPSTKRWNLVWADQIVPNWVTQGQVEFAARNYIGTQKIFANQAEQFRNFNPNFLVIIYHLAAGLNPAKNSDCPDPKNHGGEDFIGVVAPEGYVAEYPTHFIPWLENNSIPLNSQKFESMFQHYDTIRYENRVWHSDPYWLMNINNSDWQQYICDITLEWMKGNSNEGCFFDVAVETNCSLYNPKKGNPEPGNFEWWESPHYPAGYSNTVKTRQDFAQWMNAGFSTYFKKIYKAFHSGAQDYLVIPNVDQMVTTVYDPVWLDGSNGEQAVDGAMIESFGGYTGFDMWQTLERSFRHLTSRGKILIAQFYNASDYERLRRTGMYMLIKNENSYINILSGGGVEWYPEYEIDLGSQTQLPDMFDELRVAGNGWRSLWKRDYEKGMVLCNTSDDVINYSLDGEGWQKIVTTGGGPVSDEGIPESQKTEYKETGRSIDIEPGNCVVLARKFPEVVEPEVSPQRQIGSIRQLSGDEYGITILFEGFTEISCFDLYGRIIGNIHSWYNRAGEMIKFSTGTFASGVYFCLIKAGNKKEAMQFIVTRQ